MLLSNQCFNYHINGVDLTWADANNRQDLDRYTEVVKSEKYDWTEPEDLDISRVYLKSMSPHEPIHDIDSKFFSSRKVAQPRTKAREAARFFATSSLRTPRVSTVPFACLEKLGFNVWWLMGSLTFCKYLCADFACNVVG